VTASASICKLKPWEDPGAKPYLSLSGIVKRFAGVTAVDGVSLDIHGGEFFALLGPSGCGKTTLLRMLAGFETPDEGQILLDGEDLTAIPPHERPVNMMFQSYALFPHMSVEKNIAFGLEMEGMARPQIRSRVEEMLALVRLEKLARRKPDQLSGGQRQRVALARALAKKPKLILLDEPLGALDRKLREATQFELVNIQESLGLTFVIVTPDQEEAMTVSTRLAVMDEGRIAQIGEPHVVYEAPETRYVAEFIGDVNIFEGQVEQAGRVALSGGGADGAFGAGVLAGWTDHGDRPSFDVVTGVSTGAIIGLFAFLGPDYDDDLRRFYTEYSTEQLLEPSPLAALTGGSSLSDSAGYNALIDQTITQGLVDEIAREADAGRILLIGTTNLDFARPVIWNVTEIARSRHPDAITLIRDLVRASSAIPAVFPPVLIPTIGLDGTLRDELHVDGGATQQVMVFSPELPMKDIDRALGIEIDRKIYVLMNNKLEKSYEPVEIGVLSIAGKAVSSLIGGSGTGDVYKIFAIAERDGIELRLLWVPRSFDVEASEAFDPAYMTALYKLGRSLGAQGAPWRNTPPNFMVESGL